MHGDAAAVHKLLRKDFSLTATVVNALVDYKRAKVNHF